MSGGPRVRSMNVAESENRPVLGPAGNKNRAMSTKMPSGKLRKAEKAVIEENVVGELEEKKKMVNSSVNVAIVVPVSPPAVGVLRRQEQLLHSSLSMSASCSSDASSDSFRSRASTGRLMRTSSGSLGRRKHYLWKPKVSVSDGVLEFSLSPPADGLQQKKRCAWVTPNTEPCYFAFHDEEWGVPVHDDKKLFELLVLSGALAELTWPVILSKRHIFREVFADFDPIAVSKFNEKKILAPGSTARSLLSELKLRAIIENARQICKVIVEVGSFDNYIWSFVNHKPIISRFRYPRQVPVKTPKADVISKDLVRRGFRSVGPTVIYSFMQVAGITNDHLISCFRFQECINMEEGKEDSTRDGSEEKKPDDANDSNLCRGIDDLSFSSE
ncbi:Methyladenine glycosylase [Dillenia turbinata]|uniref:Methyladenine glycosylase n=1 Tax=Dillenia turbinata TaxID=194707 RepID=A0AAN8WAI9_9MAGN